MNRASLDAIARAVLYEGYVLYPYRPSSLKNARRWTFGTLYPESAPGGERSWFQMECLVSGGPEAALSVLVRFLHLDGGSAGAREREVPLDEFLVGQVNALPTQPFSFPGGDGLEPLQGEIAVRATQVAEGPWKLTLVVRNTAPATSDPELALLRSLASAHAAVSVRGGELVSLTDPPPRFAEAAAACVNTGVWPVLVGAPGSHDTMLASPIILSEYPELAPESAGDLCDGTEIEEILALRILTLTDEEKAEVRSSDQHARRILERTEALPPEHWMRLHGVIRGMSPTPNPELEFWANSQPVGSVRVNGAELKAGDRVRLWPARRADIFDSVLEGRIGVIEAVEQDFENDVHLAVVLEDDPGRDLGELRQIGHRFFFRPNEVEPV